MGIISIDLGTTNIKVAAYTNQLTSITLESHNVSYLRENGFVEFVPSDYFDHLVALIKTAYAKAQSTFGQERMHLVLTGQAESLVVTDDDGVALGNGISWLDMRSQAECRELAAAFDKETCYHMTGQPEIIPTWPLTKILWLKHNDPQRFARVGKFLLLKDYILFRLTGRFVGEHSIYPFSHYFDVTRKTWCQPFLDYCGVRVQQLPKLISPCTVVGELLPEICAGTGLPAQSDVNAGTLDHFAGMIGTGNIEQGLVSESAGTVSSIAAFVEKPFASCGRIPLYCGPFADSYIYLPVCESGGISLEWFRNNFAKDVTFQEIDTCCSRRQSDPRLTFLPYLTGINPPEFDSNATGVFFGADIRHDRFDFALAIMYGVASLLRKNIAYFEASGIHVERIISTGGGAKSALWSQIKADVCNLPVVVPKNQEAPCLGAAIIAAVTAGYFTDYAAATKAVVQMDKIYNPTAERAVQEKKHRLFLQLYDTLTPLFTVCQSV